MGEKKGNVGRAAEKCEKTRKNCRGERYFTCCVNENDREKSKNGSCEWKRKWKTFESSCENAKMERGREIRERDALESTRWAAKTLWFLRISWLRQGKVVPRDVLQCRRRRRLVELIFTVRSQDFSGRRGLLISTRPSAPVWSRPVVEQKMKSLTDSNVLWW